MIKFLDILKESISNPENIILPFNIYYADSDSKLRDIGLDSGILTEPDLMFTLWNEYQQIKQFAQITKSGGDKYTNKMQDIGFNADFKADEDKMFFGSLMSNIMDNIGIYVPEGTSGTKEKEIKDSYTNFTYGYYWDDDGEGLDFKYSKQEADKYNYMLIDDDEFKNFVNTIKQVID
jgi:hypothetical protein